MNIQVIDKSKKDIFVSIFHLLKNCSGHINATFGEDALHVQGMDKSHVCLFDLTLKKKWFSEYNVVKEKKLCFDSSIFYSIISIKSEDQSMVIKHVDTDHLCIEYHKEKDKENKDKKGDYSKFFTMPLVEYEYDEMTIPETEYDAELSLPSKKVTDMLSQLNHFGDDLQIKCSDEYVDFKTTGNSGEMRVNIEVDEMSSYSVVEGEEINLNYSLTYLAKMCITNKLSNDIDFCVSSECPMKIQYSLGDDSTLLFYIAPKVME